MKIKWSLFTLLSLFILCGMLNAATNVPTGVRTLIQDDLGERAADDDVSDARVELLDLYFKPLDLNQVEEADLLVIPGVTPALAERIVGYCEERSNIRDPSELRNLDGMDTDIYNRILPFVRGDAGRVKRKLLPLAVNLSIASRTSPFTRFVRNVPTTEKARIRCDLYEHLRISAAWSGLKRPVPGKYFFDLKNIGPLRHLMLGYYKLTFGQGLVVGSSGPSKGRDVLRIRNNAASLVAGDLSSYVNKNFFGAAVQSRVGSFLLTGFYSRKKVVAVVEDLVTLGDRLDDTPGNRNDDLLTDYDPGTVGLPSAYAEKRSYGGRVEFLSGERSSVKVRSGASAIISRFSLPARMIYTSDGSFAFSGRDPGCAGWDWNISLKELGLFGEVATSSMKIDKEHAGFYGGCAFGRTGFRNIISFRHYGLLFHNFDNDPFSEYNTGRGETGWYFGTALKPSDRTVIQFAGDLFRRNWRSHSELIPPLGWEAIAQLQHEISYDLLLQIHASAGRKELHITETAVPGNYSYSEDIRIRGKIEWKATYRFSWKGAVESVRGHYPELPNLESAEGNLIYSEFSYLFSRRSEVVLRNEVYDLRNGATISVGEDSSPANSGFKMLNGTGTRHYLFFSFDLFGGRSLLYFKAGWTAPMAEVLSGKPPTTAIIMEETSPKESTFELQFQVTSEF